MIEQIKSFSLTVGVLLWENVEFFRVQKLAKFWFGKRRWGGGSESIDSKLEIFFDAETIGERTFSSDNLLQKLLVLDFSFVIYDSILF